MTEQTLSPRRRSLLKAIASTPALSFAAALGALQMKESWAANGVTTLVDSPYGAIVPVNDMTTGLPLLQLPPGFTYRSYGWRGDLMDNGQPCPGGHDGMGVVRSAGPGNRVDVVLVRNHEISFTAPSSFIEAPAVYDRGTNASANRAGGGTTNLVFRDGKWAGMFPSLGGTQTNCAGGVTPWGSWLTCEEVGSDTASSEDKKHGYVFEVAADPSLTSGKPIIGMGRFAHEAAAVDPSNSDVYLSEDSSGRSGFYRYRPLDKSGKLGSLEKGGQLEMAKVKGMPNANLATVDVNASYELEWVPIANPDANRGNVTLTNAAGVTTTVSAAGPFIQGWLQGAARMNRGEGMWYYEGKIYVMDTSGGSASRGTIWELDLARQVLTCIYSSPNATVGNMGDNLTVSPGGGLLICEDGDGRTEGDGFGIGNRLMGLTGAGDAYVFAKNNVNLSAAQLAAAGKSAGAAGDNRTREFCGACFDPTGRFLFVNIQTPGITFAISGPWAKGPLKSQGR